MNCFACGAQIREGVRFCPFCGKDQSERPQENLCKQCGQVIRPGAKFCAHCGTAQQSEPVPEVPVIVAPEEIAANEWQGTPPAEEVPVHLEEQATWPAVEEIPAEPVADPVVQSKPVEPEPVVYAAPVVTAPVQQPAYQYEPAPVTPPPVQQPAYQYEPAPAYQSQIPVQHVYQVPVMRPAFQLPTGRGLLKMILLSLVTLGIYPMVIWSKISMEINVVASRYDGRWTMHFLWMCFLAPLTLCIYPLVWIHNLCNRIGWELQRRNVNYQFSAATFWLWNLLYPLVGAAATAALVLLLPQAGLGMEIALVAAAATVLVSLIGPFVYLHKNMKAMNLLNDDYNQNG